MLSQLNIQQCQACNTSADPISDSEKKSLLKQLPNWAIENRNKINQLEKVYSFKNFTQAINFTNQVAEMAESQNHHPALLTEWGKTTVTWWSHNIQDLHHNDFICAAKTEHIYAG